MPATSAFSAATPGEIGATSAPAVHSSGLAATPALVGTVLTPLATVRTVAVPLLARAVIIRTTAIRTGAVTGPPPFHQLPMGLEKFIFGDAAITVGVHSFENLIRVRATSPGAGLGTRRIGCSE
ncbi:hypothetical protein [Maioricimonas rarisocia]|uniref:hypothetical protein n=1 Tax=Maioricimonas rarisocia TaxID=2528026 RepID=UPI0011A5F783|nr:hypothetical protein [Maioricimonas rarisocia]